MKKLERSKIFIVLHLSRYLYFQCLEFLSVYPSFHLVSFPFHVKNFLQHFLQYRSALNKFFSFSFTKKCLSLSFLKDIFTRYKSLGLQSLRILLLMESLCRFSLAACKIYSVFGCQQLNCNEHWHGFIHSHSHQYLLSISNT